VRVTHNLGKQKMKSNRKMVRLPWFRRHYCGWFNRRSDSGSGYCTSSSSKMARLRCTRL